MENKTPKYKVWICLEEYVPEKDDYEDHDLRFASTGQFNNLDKALAFASMLHGIGQHEGICDD